MAEGGFVEVGSRGVPSDRSRVSWPAVLLAVLAGAGYRLLVFDEFTNDHYMHLAWAQQVLRGDIPGRDFVEPGMPLKIALSAAAQLLGGRGLLSELFLCVAFLSAAAGVTCWLGQRFTGSVILGLAAAGLEIAFTPRLYNYSKVFVPIVGVCLLWIYLERPAIRRAAALGIWLTIGFLFRHDYLLYLGLPILVGLVVVDAATPTRRRFLHLAVCLAAALILVLPYLAALPFAGGITNHVQESVEFVRGERWGLDVPRFAVASASSMASSNDLAPVGPVRALARAAVLRGVSLLSPIVNRNNTGGVIFFCALALPVALAGLLGARILRARPPRCGVGEAQLLSLATLSLVLALSFLRSPLQGRVADIAGPLSLLVVVAVSVAWRRAPWLRVLGIALGVVITVSVVVNRGVWHRLDAAGTLDGVRGMITHVSVKWAMLRERPWEALWPEGSLPPVIRYIAACTEPDDRVFATWFAPEVYVFANRGFAAGHAYLTGRSFFAPEHQQRMLARLNQSNVPIVLVNLPERSWLSARLDRLDRHIDTRYRVVGTYLSAADQEIAVAVRRDLAPSAVYQPTGWPCFRVPD